ncbi:hypothetical protein [Billgrantia gudaonensis]|uniref:Uncharacterized protein n=1 Tax=Billgrantia gudaonensis TaxID=376427 RepID=A0A1G8XG00_9GAMM|nr:hypothetical protein [Halomonas gudaonensis]SDJ89569.1 hypothetical protein SAMN04487954_10931 [Halomonas gudaonensis]
MHTPPWHFIDEPTGQVRISVGRFGRPVIQFEVQRTAKRPHGGAHHDNGRHWRTATRHDTALLVRMGVLEPTARAEEREKTLRDAGDNLVAAYDSQIGDYNQVTKVAKNAWRRVVTTGGESS